MKSTGNEDQLYLSTMDTGFFLICELELIQFIPLLGRLNEMRFLQHWAHIRTFVVVQLPSHLNSL